MRLSKAAKQYEDCMKESGPCLVKDCPLYRDITLKISDEVTWRVEACSLMGRLQDWLKNKKPGKPYQLPGGTE